MTKAIIMPNELRGSSNNDHIELKDNFCETMDELLNSDDFQRVFQIVLKKSGEDDIDYFNNILEKVKRNENLEADEKKYSLEILENEEVIQVAENITSKLKAKNMTMDEVRNFLDEYPANKVMDSLKEKTQREIVDVLWWEVVEKVESHSEFWLEEYKMKIDGEYKYCLKKEGEEASEEDFIFEKSLSPLKEINWEVYYAARLWWKEWYIKFWEENEMKDKLIFDKVWKLQEANGEVYYIAKLANNMWYIKLWEEENYEEKLVHSYVSELLQDENGDFYYHVGRWNTIWMEYLITNDMEKFKQALDAVNIRWEFYETMEDFIKSEDFKRLFYIIVKRSKKYDTNYFSSILDKIINDKNLEEYQKENLLEFLWNKEVIKIAKNIKFSFSDMTDEEIKKFKDKYSADKVIASLKKKAQRELVDVQWWWAAEKIKSYPEYWIEWYKMMIDGEYKYCLKKEWEAPREEDFVFDRIKSLNKVNWEVYYEVEVWDKVWHIKFWEEENYKEKVVFTFVWILKEVNWKVYYEARTWADTSWYIKFWEEARREEKLIFKNVWIRIKEENWEFYYETWMWETSWRVYFSKDETFVYKSKFLKADKKVSFEDIRNGNFKG